MNDMIINADIPGTSEAVNTAHIEPRKRPEGMEAENVRTGEQIFLFFRHFANLHQLTINA